MLDSVTKRRIDSCRDILVGKVPDPKSQVEQITIALIYKFMDDMDMEAEALGGKRSFFTGTFARYSWSNLMASDRGGFEVLALYSEAIQKMSQNIALPALFRDIFKNAYLPYRDPETLRSFLKEIQAFSYDHSEKLGDAFEYLLSVLGSQGDAGQFRTPRHIIDFMVAVIDPQKTESILDMACGTAGFLISSYKHILQHNTVQRVGDKLTPDERKRLVQNIKGYDISPDMVRLSLVNLYLHGFSEPHIIEYDTLTSEERWNELADVILANPPFMSPKGGIKPHKRFSVQSKRSEVLFVDYIAEHLTPQGRAAIVVPEGIIFQSGTAYKQLREMLLKTSLVAVISLPAGVFNPYSGVKTSILILDKPLAKKTNQIAFVKIDNDGFGLGAQRRAIDKNDLPEAHRQLSAWLAALHGSQSVDATALSLLSLIDKTRIAENGEFNFSGERYIEQLQKTTVFDMVEVGKIIKLTSGKFLSSQMKIDGHHPVYGGNGINGIHNEYFLEEPTIVIGRVGAYCGAVHLTKPKAWVTDNALYVKEFIIETNIKFFYLMLKSLELNQYAKVGGQPSISQTTITERKIPLPPLDVQEAIVAEIESYQKIIDGARQVVENYQPRILMDTKWEIIELGEICNIKSGGTPSRSIDEYWNGNIPWITTTLINFERIEKAEQFITQAGLDNSSARIMPKETVLMAMYGQGITRGRVAILGVDAAVNQACAAFLIKDEKQLLPKYLFEYLKTCYEDLRRISDARGGNQSNLSATVLKEYSIPLPDLEMQRAIVAEIEQEQRLVDANKELVRIFEEKIKRVIERVWGNS